MKKIIFCAFDMIAASQVGHGLWRHPDTQRHRYADPGYWIDIAKTLERGLFDMFFLADVYGLGGVHRGSTTTEIEHGMFFPSVDPAIYVAAMARETANMGFAITQSTSFEPPFTVMRRMCSLDHLSGGRLAWNIVTSALPSQAANHGVELVTHDERYDMADEFLDVSYKLTEGSWKPGYKGGRESGRPFLYNPSAIQKISHQGRYFKVEGPFCVEPSPQRTPLLCQAGGSGRGRRFAARHAELALVAADSPEQARAIVQNIREIAQSEFGRDPATIKFLLLCGVIADQSDSMATARIETYDRHWSREAALANLALYSGVDLVSKDPESYLGSKDTSANRSQANSRRLVGAQKKVKDIIDEISGFAKQYVMFTGGYQKVCDEMEMWLEEGDVDGFNMLPFLHPADFENTVGFVVPELQKRGRYKREYGPGTLREKLFGAAPLLPRDHPGARYRTSP